jgi:hypothetical protein
VPAETISQPLRLKQWMAPLTRMISLFHSTYPIGACSAVTA